MLNGSEQRRNSITRQSFSSPSSLNSLRVSGRHRRLNDSLRSYDYQRDPTLEQDPQVDGDVETVTEPLEMYDGGGGTRRRPNSNSSIAPTNQQVIKIVPNQGYHERQNDCPPTYTPAGISFPSILCIPCPCVSDPNTQNCPPTCVTYHPVDPSLAQPMSQPASSASMTPHLPPTSTLSIPTSSMVPQTQVNHIYTYSNAGQFERDHHMNPAIAASCCSQLQLPQYHPAPPPPRYDTQQSCPCDQNNSFSSTSYFHESPQSTCGGGGNGMRGCCPATSNDYRYFAPRRRRRCRREYYLQITKGKCRTGLEDDDFEEKSITTAGPGRDVKAAPRGTLPGTRPTHFPINFRLQKASMNEPITRPALPPTRPALGVGRTNIPITRRPIQNTSFSSKSSSSKTSGSYNESNQSMSSIATNRSANSTHSQQKTPISNQGSHGNAPSNKNSAPMHNLPPPAMKIAHNANADTVEVNMEKVNANMDKPEVNIGKSSHHAGKTNTHSGKPQINIGGNNANVGKKLVFDAHSDKKTSSKDEERPRFGSVPLIQETAASVLRKRHNEIRMQAIREMLEKDLRRLKQA